MNHSLISVRYAKALFKLVKGQGLQHSVNNDLLLVGSVIDGNKELKGFLANPLFKESQKKQILSSLFASKINPLTLKFLHLVLDKKREEHLSAIIRNYGDMFRKDQHILRVVYTAAALPDADFESKLKAQLETLLKSQIELSVKEKKELIGGFTLLVDGKLADTSISSKLKTIQKQLLAQ
ncbi:MAG: ATP synthase F1 subunit delta [Breznakibacter sp.]